MIQIVPHHLKDYILKYRRQEDIMERYLGIPVVFGKIIKSPLRRDRNPTCSFEWRKGKLRFVDFSGHFKGDCFDVVMKLFSLSFEEAVRKVAIDFGIISNGRITTDLTPLSREEVYTEDTRTEIGIIPQEWTKTDKIYWRSYFQNSKTLAKFFVYSCKHVFVNGNIVYTYNEKDPVYAYYFGNGDYKIYFPFREKDRFLSNTKIIQGLPFLPATGDLLLITKSYKDVICLDLFDINAIAPQAEGHIIEENVMNDLKKRFKNIYSLYDFDYAGVKGANRLKDNYNIPYLFFTNGKFNTSNFHQKDFSDYLKTNGIEKTSELINEVKTLLNYG
jgi:hypothetical protein